MLSMADWQQYTQSVLFGLIFSFLLAKLFSVILTFRDENLRITRANPNENQSNQTVTESDLKSVQKGGKSGAEVPRDCDKNSDEEPLIDHDKENAEICSDSSGSDDDWEGVESTELDEAFSAATAFVAATAADRSSQKVSNDLQLQLYGLYKIATEGPCSVPQPSAIKMTARAKWNAWHKLGSMPPEEAMQKYIEIITELYPTWLDGSTSKRRGGNANEPSSNETRPMGPVFSTFVHEEESENELKLDAIHAFAREGDTENVLRCVEGGVPVDTKDSEGRTPLHWAVDRGHIDVAELLLSKHADVNLKDNEGQTPLHYAAVCERKDIAELLVEKNAATNIKDDDGNYPFDLCDSNWPLIQPQIA